MNVRLLASLFATLEHRSATLGGHLATRLWFRLPPRPPAAARDRRTPAGGEPFEVAAGHGVVRGRVWGDWGRPTAYLVHGWGGWWQQLGALVQPLVDEGLCVVAFDAPGHGASDRGRDGRRTTTFLEMAAALAAVEREFGRPTVVVAHSAGALATMTAMARPTDPAEGHRSLPHPEALVLVAVPARIDDMVATFVRALGVGPRSTAVMRTLVERRIGRRMGEFDLLSLASSHPRLPRLLLVHDEDDPEAPFTGALDVSNAWHASRLVVTRGLGHRRLLWDPEVVKQVTEFAGSAADGIRAESARASRA
ncbi:alpha/beta hydrolase [Knoellia sp. CPCC 206450]|uniref:alpha/beta hydrolase n=1 Tax=Knoellia tibetensis TaxID=3404798 RepID=UPI003B42BA21